MGVGIAVGMQVNINLNSTLQAHEERAAGVKIERLAINEKVSECYRNGACVF